MRHADGVNVRQAFNLTGLFVRLSRYDIATQRGERGVLRTVRNAVTTLLRGTGPAAREKLKHKYERNDEPTFASAVQTVVGADLPAVETTATADD